MSPAWFWMHSGRFFPQDEVVYTLPVEVLRLEWCCAAPAAATWTTGGRIATLSTHGRN